MSKINAVRLINVNYNHNAIRISDEVFHLNGESTLLSLRNGGGKSVLVQMMTAPFVHKRYRDAKDRPFESYFTSSKPSFILVEWVLDAGAGYVLTGMMVRKSQDSPDQSAEELQMVNFVSEYQGACIQDIHHLPVVEKGKKEITLKSFASCVQLFEEYKKDRGKEFYYYDMQNAAQSRQYFDKLMEYQINFKEWETIIKKVNIKESGLSDLFADCKDEKGLVEKWFLDAVESKLNREKNRMKEFQSILEKYVGQYKDNQSKIRRRDTIQSFKEEAQKIRGRAEEYEEAARREKSQENLVAHFIRELELLRGHTKEQHEEVLAEAEELLQAAARVEYEKLSQEVHELERKERFHSSNRDMIGMEQEDLERDAGSILRTLHLLALAKQQERVDEREKELEVARQKLKLSRRKDEDSQPERNRLGYSLKCHYQEALEKNEREQEESRRAYQNTAAEAASEEEKIAALEQGLLSAAAREGALKERAAAYDRQEEAYSKRYGEPLVRNILGEYEPGAMEIRRESYQKELLDAARERVSQNQSLDNCRGQLKTAERTLLDLRGEHILRKSKKEQEEQIKARYDGELKERSVILKYLNLGGGDLFDTDKILHASANKLQEIEGIRRNLEKEEDALKKEYVRLTQGNVLELTKEFEDGLESLGIHVVYGMEWLKKNGYSKKENQELVRRHPFLPYALILSKQEISKLSGSGEKLYTSAPIPIIQREQLEDRSKPCAGSVVRLADVSFYVLFNENLLDEEKLLILVQEKERQIKKKQEALEVRQSEYREYFERQELIRNQEVTGKGYEEKECLIDQLSAEIQDLDEGMRSVSADVARLKDNIARLEETVASSDRELERQKRRMEDYQELLSDYEAYLVHRRELERCGREADRLKRQKNLSQVQCEKLKERLRSLETKQDTLARESQRLKDGVRRYEAYAKGELLLGDIAGLEARFEAITSAISQEIRELEEQHRRAGEHCANAAEELSHLKKKYGLSDGAWQGVRYSRKEEGHQEALLEDRQRKIEEKKSLWNEENKNLAVAAQQKSERIERIRKECGQDSPLPEEEIKDQDFEARKNQLVYQEHEKRKTADRLLSKMHSFDEHLTALSEYTQFEAREPVVWDQDFGGMDKKELRNFKGGLVRDYNQAVRDGQGARERLTQALNQIVRMEAFEEDFYRKPLEAMLTLTDDAGQVLGQLRTTLQSYDNLMEKLRVDISVVEKEKEKIAELLEDYIQEVHHNLGRIDGNSTITIRERPVKMLKILTPSWEDNESLYRIHLEDFIDEITQRGIRIFENNENAQEYFGIQVTTKNLYDTVVGIGNVQVRLYKIEELREYAITWAEVAKNSGGEGFLSAFVILSSLLYYMRKDESDLFADRNEGKVLLMDNPFAQTNASHLLKPLMDMAWKTNTQLICLTGLGGESIYNRFDNIYVLNLIAASLKNGMHYLTADHMRGEEPETMVVSQVEVVEQQELVF